jgi:N-acetylmuramoyl-L-alanine amidase
MTRLLALAIVSLLGVKSPDAVLVVTSRGETAVPVARDEGHPALPVPLLSRLLPITEERFGAWAEVAFAGEPFRFLLGAPAFVQRGKVLPISGGAYVLRDTLFVPLQWLAEYVPRLFREGYRYDPVTARFEEARFAGVASPPPAAPVPQPPVSVAAPSALARRNGFRIAHRVVVDAGHGGSDPGNPGRYLPRGVQEKHVNLAVAKDVQAELTRRGVDVVMTRTTDVLIGLRRRAPMCRDECDLFVSIHVNSLKPRRGYENINGVETYFLGEALTAEARRVAQMENDALRYEGANYDDLRDDVSFIFKDLETNELLRESALLAQLVQARTAATHPGLDRGVAQAPYTVLTTATRPAILVETGFATNRRDGQFLASRDGQRKVAKAIADGIVEYLKRYERKVLVGASP